MKSEKRNRVTLQQVAEHAGVSRATASLIVRGSPHISEPTRKKVLESMQQLGYVYDRVAANLRSRSSSTVGLIITEIGNPYFSELLVGVHQALDQEGYTVILGTTFDSNTKQDQLISTMLEYRVGGVIMSAVSGSPKESIDRLNQWDIPVVLVAREPAEGGFDYVGVDNVLGAKMAVDYLIRKGHRRIAYLGGPSGSSPRKERMRGYCAALEEAGLPVDESLLVESEATRQGGMDAVRQILRHPDPPTAVLCYNDIVAFGAMHGLKEAGLVPGKDLAVVGFDNIQEAALTSPGLTTISASPQLIGAKAAHLLHQRIMGMDLERQRIILPPEIVIRESCS